jgi:hypothetical protein
MTIKTAIECIQIVNCYAVDVTRMTQGVKALSLSNEHE